MADFKKGDVVMLKSGGPAMTVLETGNYNAIGTGPEDGVKCVWFDKAKKFDDVFDAATIEIVDQSPLGFTI